MDANNFFANKAGLPLSSFKRNQFGASAGGPLWDPKLYIASYTWSKTITDAADGLWNRPANDVTNWYCRACERAVSSYDQPHRFVTNVTYELPVGKSKFLGSNWNGWLDNLLGQWQVNAILTLSQGQPLRFYLPQNTCF